MSVAKTQMSAKTSSTRLYERAAEAAKMIRSRIETELTVAVVLGSGLGAFANELSASTRIRYEEIPGFARATVEGHAGQLVVGQVSDVKVAAMQGRFHFYEGY